MDVIAQLKERSSSWRVGSRWDPHSKLEIYVEKTGEIRVEFYPNFAPQDRQSNKYAEAEAAGIKFAEEITKILN